MCAALFLVGEEMHKQQGFYILKTGKRSELAYSCYKCGIFCVFGEERPARAYCCGTWKTPTQKSVDELPIIEMASPSRPTVLRGNVVDFGAGAETENQQSFA
jgi:hypothetical protein